MTIDEIRRQLHSITHWPVYLRADGATLEIPSLDQVALPTAGNLLCVFQNGAYVVLDCAHVSAVSNQRLPVESGD